mmetsp:Transcript_4375/g.9024  ORF Transcript_4375/g.9024 Transcript_4375/m.9024 type:complete len:914 (+) Transcript_4375:48-2789(+)
MSDNEDDTGGLPSPSYVPSDEEEEGGGGLPASPTHDPDNDDEEDDNNNIPGSPTYPTSPMEEDNGNVDEQEQADDTTTTTQKTPIKDDLKWYASYDDEGRVYYYNSETQETSWDPPAEGFHPPPETDEGAAARTTATTEPETIAATAQPAASSEWAAYRDDEGREYYYNATTGETQWEAPEGYVAPAVDGEEEGMQQQQQQADGDVSMEDAPTTDQAMDTTRQDEPSPVEQELEKEPEEEIDPEVLKLQQAQTALEQPDSVMERTCIAHVAELAKRHNGNPEHALAMLVENYQGQTAVCGLLSQWLCRLKASNNNSNSSSNMASSAMNTTSEQAETSAAAAEEIRESIQDVINRIAKENFSKDVGDGILNLSSEDASFLQEMIHSSRWRKLLIDLSASHKESAVLKLCLKMISKGGHHREIARRINQSEHFSVFHQMLQSELTAIGRLSVSAGSDMSIGFTELMQDLERACTSTSYTYLYSLEMIRALIDSVDVSTVSSRFQRAVRKWEVLAQILEETLVDPNSIGPSSAPLFRKRRLDVALTISELHQRQGKKPKTNGKTSVYEKALLAFLRKHASGIQVADSLLDPLLPTGLDLSASQDVGRLMIEHPLAIRALLGHLYKPGQTRVTNPVTKNKCARLVAFSVLAAEEKTRTECPTLSESLSSDEVALTTTILQGAQLCEQLESMISFLVVSTPKTAHQPGPKLVGLAQDCAAVAQGIMIWAKAFTFGTEFSGSASFPTLSVCILSLVRVVAIDQPFTRKEAIQIALQFLAHSNSDISYKKVSEIKEQSLRLLVFLLVKGEVVGVLEAVMKMVAKKGSSDLDASLIRYFVGGVVAVVKPPVSFIFARLFVKLLRSPSCVDAVRSKYFADESRARLGILLKSFQNMKTSLKDSVSKDDQQTFDSAVSLYQVE